MIAGAARTSIALHSEVVKSNETVKATRGRPQFDGRCCKHLVASLLAIGERLQRSPHKDPERRPGLRPGRLQTQRCALREARTFTSFRFSLSRFALRPARRDPPGIAGNERNSRETAQLLVVSLIFHCASFVPERFTPKTGRTH